MGSVFVAWKALEDPLGNAALLSGQISGVGIEGPGRGVLQYSYLLSPLFSLNITCILLHHSFSKQLLKEKRDS